MAEAFWSVAYPIDADTMWKTIRQFDGLPAWHPDFGTSEIIDGAGDYEIGAVRVLTLNDGGEFRERLVGLDDSTRTLTYDIISAPAPVANYRGSMQVIPISDTKSSLVIWRSTFDPTDGSSAEDAARAMAEGAYAPALAALREYVS
ncbi:SRPBCC family protein [Rhodococcus sp. IEGM 1381]|uniref:SRPBCC family protein n=1 Tax=Rhodococcus sp. IEGM 1381 TaxID=3047085 RepID=UPI0024B86507|nr:SRPBCC family protein [Rhodococcus sp. IEGM 1381]MDI9894528.1 SRPBCC family protein [Rhodococcus sp. IEGM 1381]